MTNANDPAFPAETWIPIPDFPNYQVSDMGRVKYRDGKIKKPQLNRNGYLYVVLWKRPAYKAWQLHRLVLSVFTAPRDRRYDVCHNNGVRTDNRMENLRWATRKENEADKIRHGTKAVGEKNGQSKLKRWHVDEIWMALYKGISQKVIAKQYGLCQQTISAIANGKTWTQIHD